MHSRLWFQAPGQALGSRRPGLTQSTAGVVPVMCPGQGRQAGVSHDVLPSVTVATKSRRIGRFIRPGWFCEALSQAVRDELLPRNVAPLLGCRCAIEGAKFVDGE
jgi:hypothetical protein